MSDFPAPPAAPTSAETWRTAYYRALELAEFRGGFLVRSAHELRSPLNQVISLHQMILEGLCDTPEEEAEFLSAAHAAALKLLEQLDFLIYLSKVETGQLEPHLQPVSLAMVLDQIKTLTHLQAANRNLRLVIEPPDPHIQVWADPNWLINALVTLMEGAIASCQRGTLHLYTAPTASDTHYHLWLDDDRPADLWQEPTPLGDWEKFDLDRPLPLGLRHSLVAALLEGMAGRLEQLEVPETDTSPNHRLQCTLPRYRSDSQS
ncbi:sensor histidine kinase [Leptolyngbya sp. PCC 6406]|uniref:sensor histidine kinase n=1 Tax=Leptolyngbya sp. PCC 6406 TaxID=1173264 RepID=UPI0002AC50C7|nr:histidine kinase dimerization/phospho-acceptor domain-containing protein [Leptolyngbya sp. PCC 6406]